MNVLLKSAVIVDSSNEKLHLKNRDILIKDGKIARIASKIDTAGRIKTIELPNLHVSRGWFDSSVSFGEPGFEERETIDHGLKVAAQSGFTDIVLNPNTHPLPDSSGNIIFLINKNAGQPTQLHPLGTLTVDSQGSDLAELYDMKNAGAVGFYDYKKPVENSNLLKIALQYSQNFGGMVMSFPLDTQIAGHGIVNEGTVSTSLGLKGIPALAEELQITRDLFILEYTEGSLHIPTISTARSMKLISEARKKGLNVSCSVPIHNLWFTDNILEGFDSDTKLMPPLRSKEDVQALRKGLKEGLIDFVTSDHTPIDIEEKRVEYDNAAYGSIGLESAFGALNQIYDTATAVEILNRGRERFGIQTTSIAAGNTANLSLFDPDPEFEFTKASIFSTSKNSIFKGQVLKGKVYGVYGNNRLEIRK